MSQPNVGEELSKAAVEPLLPIEKKLIGWSFGAGIARLALGHRCYAATSGSPSISI